jgi:hypothetical protein
VPGSDKTSSAERFSLASEWLEDSLGACRFLPRLVSLIFTASDSRHLARTSKNGGVGWCIKNLNEH